MWSGPAEGAFDEEAETVAGPPVRRAQSFTAGSADPLAELRLAVALEELDAVGAPVVAELLTDRVEAIIALADERGIPVVSPRAAKERAGIVVIEPDPARLSLLSASLHNHGVTAGVQQGRLRLSPHAATSTETLAIVESAFAAYSSAIPV